MAPISVQQRLKDLQRSSAGSHAQDQSPLFSIIPAEIRDQIFTLALIQCEDQNEVYDDDTCYKRPGYLAHKRIYTDLLRSCKRVYNEAWFLPWTNSEHVFYFASDARKPFITIEPEVVEDLLWDMFDLHGEAPKEVEHVQIFAQIHRLENSGKFGAVCDMPFFKPRRMTVTIRHTDFANWEGKADLTIDGTWIQQATLPESVNEVYIEFENTVERQDQVDFLADQAALLWYFKRKDDAVLVADAKEKIVMRWTRGSTWAGKRWRRHESRPNEIDYYVRTIKFKLRPGLDEENLKDHDQGASLEFVSKIGPDWKESSEDDVVSSGDDSVQSDHDTVDRNDNVTR